MKIKIRYLWKKKWFYIDFQKDNLAYEFNKFEKREKTTKFQLLFDSLDKLGEEIYEGDIIRYKSKGMFNDEEGIGEIKWRDIGFSCLIKGHHTRLTPKKQKMHLYIGLSNCDGKERYGITSTIEVIGNIHENPELLKQ